MTHPIENLMNTAMENLENIINVNTIIGDPIATPDGGAILTVSKVGFGFAAGGSQFGKGDTSQDFPFGGGSGGGVSITPIAFLVVNKEGVKVMHLGEQTHTVEKMIEMAPQAMEKIKGIMSKSHQEDTSTDNYKPR